MEKTKTKDNLRAAGKKRLEEYRQKRQQKESPNNSVKASAEDDQSLDHQTSDSISDPDGDEAASAGIVSMEEDDSTLTTDFPLEVGSLQLSSQLNRRSTGSNGGFHPSLSFSQDKQERSRAATNDIITSDAAGTCEEPERLVLYESEDERHGWNVRGEVSLPLSVKPTQLGAQWQESMFDRIEKIDSNMHQYNHVHDRVEEDLSFSWSEDTDSRDGSTAMDGTKAGLEELHCNCLGAEDASGACTQEGIVAESSRGNTTPDFKWTSSAGFKNFLQPPDGGEVIESLMSLTREEYLEQERLELVGELNKSHQRLQASWQDRENLVKDFESKVGTLKAQMADCQTHMMEQVVPAVLEGQFEVLERTSNVLKMNGIHPLQQMAFEERLSLVPTVEDLRAQAGYVANEREQLSSTVEASESVVDRLTREMERHQKQSKDQIENMVEERSKLAAQLQTALKQIQAATESEALSASELRGVQEERDHEKGSCAAEVWKLLQQDLGKDSICLMNGVNQQLQFKIEELADEVDSAIQEGCRKGGQITTQGSEHAKGLDLEKLETFSTMMDGLSEQVQILEEEKINRATACNESSHSVQEALVAEGLEAAVTGMKETEQEEVQRLELGAESQMVQEQLQADSIDGIPKEAPSQEEKDEEAGNCLSKFMEVQQQLRTLEQENEELANRFQAVEQLLKERNDENEHLSTQLETVLQERERREEEISNELGTWKEHAHSLEVEKLMYLSIIEKSHERLQRLEEENKQLETSNDECGQSLQHALQEITLLANEVGKLEQEMDLQMGRTLEQAADLQKAQEQLKAASERDVCLVAELKELDAERVESQLKVQELQMQMQDLTEDNVDVAAKVRQLDQKLEALASEKRELASQADQLVQDRQRREAEIAEELGTWKEHVQNLEAEKLEFFSSAEDLNQQIRRLGEDKKKLINESNQSMQELWGENARLKKEIGKLEAEKDRQEGERLELAAGLQTVWEKLQAANERETFLTKELTGLQGWRDAELTGSVAKIQELQQQLQELTEKYDVMVTQSLETSQMLEGLLMDKVQLGEKVTELVLERESREEEIAREQVMWKEQLEAEKSKFQSEIENLKLVSEDLNEQLQRSGEEIIQLGMRSAEFSKMLEELQEEKARLLGELDKLEEVKERQEGERLELAAKLQVAWNQLSEVHKSETHLISELHILREERERERLKSAGEAQDLQCQLHQLQEDKGQLLTRVQELTQTLESLRDAKELQETNSRLAIEVVKLEQEKVVIDTERLELMRETQALKLQVQNVERDKSKLASEIEELNQWLHRPAAEKRQLATKLDEVTQMLQRLQVDNTQLVSKLEKLEQEIEATKKENKMLNLEVHRLEEESSLISEHEELYLQQLQQLEMEVACLRESSCLVQELGAEISTLKAYVFLLVAEKGNLRQAIKLDEVTKLLQTLHVGNFQLVGKVHKLEQEGEKRTEENRKLNLQVQRLDDEMKRSVA